MQGLNVFLKKSYIISLSLVCGSSLTLTVESGDQEVQYTRCIPVGLRHEREVNPQLSAQMKSAEEAFDAKIKELFYRIGIEFGASQEAEDLHAIGMKWCKKEYDDYCMRDECQAAFELSLFNRAALIIENQLEIEKDNINHLSKKYVTNDESTKEINSQN